MTYLISVFSVYTKLETLSYAPNGNPCSVEQTMDDCPKDSDFSTELQNILDEQFNPDRPNAVWCSDITYIWTIDGFVYLTSVMDLISLPLHQTFFFYALI